MKKINKEKFNLSLQKLFEMVALLFLVNLTFLIVNVVGGIIFTLGPTLKASHKVIMKHLNHDKVIFFKDFFKEFYNSYFLSIFITIPHILLISASFIGLYFSYKSQSGNILVYVTMIITFVFMIYILTSMMFVFFFKNRLDCSYWEAFKLSLTHPWGKFGYLLIILIIILSSFILCYLFVTLFLVFLFGLYFLIIEYFGSKAFTKSYFINLQKKIDDKKMFFLEVTEELKAEDLEKAKKIFEKKQSKNHKKNKFDKE